MNPFESLVLVWIGALLTGFVFFMARAMADVVAELRKLNDKK